MAIDSEFPELIRLQLTKFGVKTCQRKLRIVGIAIKGFNCFPKDNHTQWVIAEHWIAWHAAEVIRLFACDDGSN